MPANESAAYGIYPSTVALNEALLALSERGFEKESICLMLSPTHPIAATVRESSGHPFERVANARAADLIGWLSEFGAVVIPTFGFFIRSRQFFHALVLQQRSVTRCGGGKTLAALGFPQEDAEHFEKQVRELGALLYVSSHENLSALELLRSTGAQEAGLLQNEAALQAAA